MSREVRVGIAGVGNCAASLVQGVEHYRKNPEEPAGLMHPEVGGLTCENVQFVSAFDVSASKVGLDLSEAIYAEPNCASKIEAEVPYYDVTVLSGQALDGVGDKYAERIEVVASAQGQGGVERVAEHLRATRTEVLVSYMPVGSTAATHFYAEAAILAGCGFVNAVPVPLVRDPEWAARFADAGLPVIGDDIKSQFGATIVHRNLVQLMQDRGYWLDRTYQLNVGGTMDFFNMLQQNRLHDKKVSKGEAVTSVVGHAMDPEDVHIGPSDYVPFLGDHKVAFIRLEGQGFGGAKFNLELRMDVEDSPNSAGIVIDAVRAVKLGLERGEGGVLDGPSAWLMKAPRFQTSDEQAKADFEEWAAS